MKRWTAFGLVALAGLLGSLVYAQETKGISWKHGLSFQVRKAGQTVFTESTPKFGAEVFLDRDLSKAVYIAETGSLSLGSSDKLGDGQDVKAPLLYHALEVRVRPVGESSFDKAKKFSSEVFRDVNAENLVYISEAGSIGVTPAGSTMAPKEIKDPVWFHGMELKVRKAGEKDFSDATKKVALEVYRDENTNMLFYCTDAGAIAVVPAAGVGKPTEVKSPTWYHAFEVKARKADEKTFTKDTKSYGVEVYKDDNANTLVYICETGAIAVVPAGGVSKPTKSEEPEWKYGRAFRVRKADDPDFNDKTPSFGAEVYLDKSVGNLVYISESGALSVTSGK